MEAVLQFGLRLVSNDYQSSYCTLLEKYCMQLLAKLYYQSAAVLVYKFVYGLHHCPIPLFANFLELSSQRRSRRATGFVKNTIKGCNLGPFNEKGNIFWKHVYMTSGLYLGFRHCGTCSMTISYCLSTFRLLVLKSDEGLFQNFCAAFKYHNVSVYDVYVSM